MLDVKGEFDFFFSRGRPNLNHHTNEERNLNNIPEFQTISYNSRRDIYRLKHHFRKRASYS